MLHKKIGLTYLLGVLLFLLAACNNNDQAMDTNLDENVNISSLKTDINSEDYPHTENTNRGEPHNPNDNIDDVQRIDYRRMGRDLVEQQPSRNSTQQQLQMNNPEPQSEAGQEIDTFVREVIALTNQERQQRGIPPLKAYPDLSHVAQVKAQDMENKDYFSHTSPTYGSPFDMMRDFGISYQAAGENIAQGQRSPEAVVEAWMNSKGHRENILSDQFTHIGVGFEESGNQWVQMLIRK